MQHGQASAKRQRERHHYSKEGDEVDESSMEVQGNATMEGPTHFQSLRGKLRCLSLSLSQTQFCFLLLEQTTQNVATAYSKQKIPNAQQQQ